MRPVEEFLVEAEKKPVFVQVYSYYDKALEMYNQPVIEDKEPDFMFTSIRAGLIKGTFPKEKAAGLLFVHLGKFNIKTGDFVIFDEPRVIVDCDKILNNSEVLN